MLATWRSQTGSSRRRSTRMPFTKHSPTLRSAVSPYRFRQSSLNLFCRGSVCAFHFAVQRAKLGGFLATAVGAARRLSASTSRIVDLMMRAYVERRATDVTAASPGGHVRAHSMQFLPERE